MSKLTPGLLQKRLYKQARKGSMLTYCGDEFEGIRKAQAVCHADPHRQPNPSKLELWLHSLPTK